MIIRCPVCKQEYDVTEDMIGEVAECDCGNTFTIEKPKSSKTGKSGTKGKKSKKASGIDFNVVKNILILVGIIVAIIVG